MNPLKEAKLIVGARTDAKHGVDLNTTRIEADLGPRPQLRPAENPEHGEWVRILADRAHVGELREDITRAEDSTSNLPSPIGIVGGLALTVFVEVVGSILIMSDVGVDARERLPLACALAFAVIGLTAVAARSSASSRSSSPDGSPPTAPDGATIRRTIFSLVVLGAYTALVASIAVIRVLNALDEETVRAQAFANALVMLATAIGPAWCAELLLRRWRRSVPARKHLKMLRRRLKEAERKREQAQAAVNRITQQGARWDSDAARSRALYTTHHRLTSAKGNS